MYLKRVGIRTRHPFQTTLRPRSILTFFCPQTQRKSVICILSPREQKYILEDGVPHVLARNTWKMSGGSKVIVPRYQRALAYPVDRALTHLTIDGLIFINHLLDPPCSTPSQTALANLKSLSLRHLTECAFTFRNAGVLDVFFQSISSMNKLECLTLDHFTLPDPNHPPEIPACLANSPIPVKSLAVQHSHGESLSFIFECFEPDNLFLEACWFIRHIPACDRLVLRQIQAFYGFFDVLVGWDGDDELVIDHCPFLDEAFIKGLRRVMIDAEEVLWPGANVSFYGYGYAVWKRIVEFQDLRWQLEAQ